LALKTRNTSSAEGRSEAVGLKGALQLPQKRLVSRLRWPHAAQATPSGFPHVSQNALVALLSLLQYRQSMRETLSHHWLRIRLPPDQWLFHS
jgi:hypothetical protein